MPSYRYRARRRLGLPLRVWLLLLGLIVVVVGGIVVARHVYYTDLQPVSSIEKPQVFTIKSGSSVKQIADNLEHAQLIRSAWAFELYVHSQELNNKLQAGTYAFSPDESTNYIVTILTKGRVSAQLVTILPGRRIDQV